MRAAAQKSRSGELLDARYELHELLESSATYDSYRATDRKTSRTVEVKLLRAELALQSKVVLGFLGGPKTLTGLRHPNVSQVLAVDSDETGIPFIVQEHVEGEPLSRVLAGFPDGMPLGVAVNMISPVVEAIAAAHELGLVHGELDREHVLLTKQGGSSVPKVVRFLGRAEAREAEGGALRAPELRSGKASPDARSDVWAIGALLYETLSGVAPEQTAPGGGHSPLDERAPHLSTDLVELVERCLASDPAKRPARANEVQVALSAVTERLRAGSRSTAEPQQAPRLPSRPMQPPAVPARPVGRGTAVARRVALPSLGGAPTDPSLDAAFAATFAGDPPQVQDQERSAAAKRLEIGLGATIAMAKSPIASVIPLPIAEAPIAEPEADLLLPADDEPEIVLESVSPSLAPRLAAAAGRRSGPPAVPAPTEVKTLSDLVLAFSPIEGEDRVGQAEVPSAARARAFRKSMQGEQAQSPAAKDGALAETVDESRTKSKKTEREKAGAPLGSPKQLRQANAQTRPLSEDQVRQLRESTQQGERRRSRALGLLLLLLFLFALLFAIPLLWDPTRAKAQALFGARTKVAVAALAILSVIALVRTWSMQLQLHPFMLRPVTTTLRVVTACVCVLSATYFLPNGALGPAESAARFALPWAGGAFYLFFGIYGMLQAIRTASTNALQGLALALLCSGGFFGSYRAIATTVLTRQRAAHGSGVGVHFGGVRGLMGQMRKYASGKVEQPDAGAEEQMVEQHHLGGSEAEDLRGIEQLQNARKRKGSDLQKLGDKIHEIAR